MHKVLTVLFLVQVKTFFASDDTGLGLSSGELCSHIIDVLTSSRSDDELQNEVCWACCVLKYRRKSCGGFVLCNDSILERMLF